MQKLQTTIPLYIYLHTHWDREWFLPFNTLRALLLDRVKKTLAAHEAKELPNFYLDGQAIVFEDLLEVEPSLADKLKHSMQAGLLSAGPWYILPDQSLVSGESLVRNLKVGIEITKRFGQPAMTGYNPDTFCHIQDLPRILNGCNIDTAFVLRGVPPLNGTNVFWWESPDGSRVLTYWLNKGLTHQILHKTEDAQKIADNLHSYWPVDTLDEKNAPLLFSAGGEGMQPPGDIANKLEKLNKVISPECKAEIVSIEHFIEDLKKWAKDKKLPEIFGELRDNSSINERFPAYILDGVSSTRLYLKRANALAEHRLIRQSEPLFAILNTFGVFNYPSSELTYIWKLLLQNHPHDSICGCSVDPVHQEMMTRTQQLNSFLDGLDHLAKQAIGQWKAGEIVTEIKKSALPAVTELEAIDPDCHNDRLLIFNTSSYPLKAPVKLTWYCSSEDNVKLPAEQFQIETNTLETNFLLHSEGGFYYKPVRRIEGWAWSGEVPAFGFSEYKWDSHSKLKLDKTDNAQLKKVGENLKIENGLISAYIDSSNSLVVTVAGKSKGFKLGHHLYDMGDGGDSYNFDPLPNDEPIKAKLLKVKPGKKGPLVASLLLTYQLDIPESLDSKTNGPDFCENRLRSKKLLKHTIQTEITLKKGVPILFFETVFENHSYDHRLEVRFDTGALVKSSLAEHHFSTASQPAITEKPKLPVAVGYEIPAQSPFCQRFFIASGQAFFNCGMPEYRTEKESVAITLLRAVSYLSRGRLRSRGGGAGPWYATPEANCLGTSRSTYAWAFLGEEKANQPTEKQIIQAYQLADLFEGRLIPFAIGKFETERKESFIEISNPALYLTAAYINNEKLLLRVLNVSSTPQKASIKITLPVSSAGKTNLLGEDIQYLPLKKEPLGAKSLEVQFKANELLTIQLEPS